MYETYVSPRKYDEKEMSRIFEVANPEASSKLRFTFDNPEKKRGEFFESEQTRCFNGRIEKNSC